ncbi:MAG: diguanylate cyclase, partial [Streptosporangiaceae bacterium]|nr:diguanylate cyclase [Streptosporangiaceae bacterium]
MSVLGMVAWSAAAVSLWLGAARRGARGYRWLAAAATLEAGGLVLARVLGGALSLPSGLSFADLPPLLALGAAAVGIAVLAGGTTPLAPPAALWHGGLPPPVPPGPAAHAGASRPPVSSLAGVADGYVTAVALLVIGWVTMFGAEFHRSGDRPETFLVTLIHPLADLAVLGALLPVASTAWRRVALPYLALLALAVGDALAVGQRVFGGHPGVAAQLMPVAAALLAGAAPWVPARSAGERATAVPASATVIAVLAASAAALVVMVNGVAGAPVSAGALVVAGGAGVLVLAARAFMLARDNGVVLRTWRQSAASLRDLADRTSDAVVVCDLGGLICYAGQAVQDYGYQPGALAGRRLLELVHPGDRRAAVTAARLGLADDAVAARAASVAGSSAGRVPVRVRAADGTWRHVEASVLRYRAPGEPTRMLVTARDVSDQVALRQQVTYLTFHDGLTGLPNRAYVEERARAVLRDGAVSRAGVIFLDLDRFTAVNDSVGHGAGDLVLAQAARRLRAIAPPQHTVARWGSDEFAVLVENAASAQEVTEIADRLADAISAEPFRVSGQQIALTASAGVAIANVAHLDHLGHLDHSGQPGTVLRDADVAMSRAKEAGGDRVEVYAAHMHADTARRREIVSDLQRAIAGSEVSLAYQPIVDLTTSRVTGAEALVRWPRGGLPDARAPESTERPRGGLPDARAPESTERPRG